MKGTRNDVHGTLLTRAAKQHLASIGLDQKGRSRTWLDDQGWFLIVVEFQPSSYSKGSYLNIGCNWLWNPKDYLSFDYGSRLEPFKPFINEQQFAFVAEFLARRAADEVLALRAKFPDPAGMLAAINPTDLSNPWTGFHLGIANGLQERPEEARRLLQSVQAKQLRMPPWLEKLQQDAVALNSLVGDPDAFRKEIEHRVLQRAYSFEAEAGLAGLCSVTSISLPLAGRDFSGAGRWRVRRTARCRGRCCPRRG